MAGFLLIALFTASAGLAIASIAHSLHHYGPAALRVGKQLSECPERKAVLWKVTTIETRTAAAQILRLDFRPRARAQTHYQQLRGLRQNGSVQGGKAKEYVDISSLSDAALSHFGQIPSGRPNGFHPGLKAA